MKEIPKDDKKGFDQFRYINDYKKVHYRRFLIQLHKEKDADVIQKLEEVPNKSAYVKDLIREDLKERKA